MQSIEDKLEDAFSHARYMGQAKVNPKHQADTDVLMDVFGLSPQEKRAQAQFWGQCLGHCWEKVVTAVVEEFHPGYSPKYKQEDGSELCDLYMGNWAIDTKYRMGTGCSYTAKKYKAYGDTLQDKGFRPVMLFLRDDNNAPSIRTCSKSWDILEGKEAFDFLEQETMFDLWTYLKLRAGHYEIAA